MFFFPDIPIVMRFRGFLYSFLMKKCGKNFQITHNAKITALTGLEVGNNVFIGNNNMIMGLDIIIGDQTLIGPNCVLVTTTHVFDGVSFSNFSTHSEQISIGKGSWIGANATVLRGSVLPDKSILAAGSVLNNQMEKTNSIYGGIPAKFIKKI